MWLFKFLITFSKFLTRPSYLDHIYIMKFPTHAIFQSQKRKKKYEFFIFKILFLLHAFVLTHAFFKL
jgi:hypothetical protein